ncbi:anti-sigma factor [Arthrobacter sp. M4]|uniref:anti-sigma factor n=1 Tax=Arthrobacter sp. M4 TaxID=218160 RepID=UPI001CDBE739|nr:anti-sigma factor [Arthrobacter sp. M4]MCA4132308.1 anti-sigma factor [Arthrobacter sp. M4]
MTTGEEGSGYVRRMFAQDIATDLAEGRLTELAEIYALDAITDPERAVIDDYVTRAPETERTAFLNRVRTARETLAATFAAEEEPPAGLIDQIVAKLPPRDADQTTAIAYEPGSPRPSAEATTGTGDQSPALSPSGVGDSGLIDLSAARNRRESRRRVGGIRRWLVAAAAALVIATGGVGIGTYVASQNDPLNQVLQAQDVRQATVQVIGGGTATVTVSASHDAAVVRMKDVPAPPPGKVYQMWLIPRDGSDPVSQGLMDAAALSRPALVKGISGAASLGITVEPVGGSKKPSLPTVANAQLSA